MKKKLKDIVLFFQALWIKIIMPCHVECHGFWRHIRINTISKTARVAIGIQAHLDKVSFLIGDNGSVCIDEGARLRNVTFHLCGTNAKVRIGSYCVITIPNSGLRTMLVRSLSVIIPILEELTLLQLGSIKRFR